MSATNGQELGRISQQNMKNKPMASVVIKAVEDQPLTTSLFSVAPEMLDMSLLRFGHLTPGKVLRDGFLHRIPRKSC